MAATGSGDAVAVLPPLVLVRQVPCVTFEKSEYQLQKELSYPEGRICTWCKDVTGATDLNNWISTIHASSDSVVPKTVFKSFLDTVPSGLSFDDSEVRNYYGVRGRIDRVDDKTALEEGANNCIQKINVEELKTLIASYLYMPPIGHTFRLVRAIQGGLDETMISIPIFVRKEGPGDAEMWPFDTDILGDTISNNMFRAHTGTMMLKLWYPEDKDTEDLSNPTVNYASIRRTVLTSLFEQFLAVRLYMHVMFRLKHIVPKLNIGIDEVLRRPKLKNNPYDKKSLNQLYSSRYGFGCKFIFTMFTFQPDDVTNIYTSFDLKTYLNAQIQKFTATNNSQLVDFDAEELWMSKIAHAIEEGRLLDVHVAQVVNWMETFQQLRDNYKTAIASKLSEV